MSETSEIVKPIIAALEKRGVLVCRNNVGCAKFGQRFVRYGLRKGSADIIAIVPPLGRVLSIECKLANGKKPTPEQLEWADTVRSMGGVSIFAKSVSDATRALDEMARS